MFMLRYFINTAYYKTNFWLKTQANYMTHSGQLRHIRNFKLVITETSNHWNHDQLTQECHFQHGKNINHWSLFLIHNMGVFKRWHINAFAHASTLWCVGPPFVMCWSSKLNKLSLTTIVVRMPRLVFYCHKSTCMLSKSKTC